MARKKRSTKHCNNCGAKITSKDWVKVYQMIKGKSSLRLTFCDSNCLHLGVLNWAKRKELEDRATATMAQARIEQEREEENEH